MIFCNSDSLFPVFVSSTFSLQPSKKTSHSALKTEPTHRNLEIQSICKKLPFIFQYIFLPGVVLSLLKNLTHSWNERQTNLRMGKGIWSLVCSVFTELSLGTSSEKNGIMWEKCPRGQTPPPPVWEFFRRNTVFF